MCDRCARLEERVAGLEDEVAYLRSEMGLSVSATRVGLVRAALKLRPGCCKMLLAMFDAKGRVLNRFQLAEAHAHPNGGDTLRAVNVHMCLIRKRLGQESIEGVWGVGYRLTDAGRDKLARILEAA